LRSRSGNAYCDKIQLAQPLACSSIAIGVYAPLSGRVKFANNASGGSKQAREQKEAAFTRCDGDAAHAQRNVSRITFL
jgi:hypothetical protein